MDISALCAGFPGISPVWGASLAEAASVSLETNGHAPPSTCDVDGEVTASHELSWPPIDDQIRRTWGDLDEAVEHGAYGLAALLVAEHTDLEVVERSRKGKGFDYWLGPKGEDTLLFQRTARLEVSGIGRGDESAVTARVKKKLKQISVSDGQLPGYVVIVEFGSPRARVIKK